MNPREFKNIFNSVTEKQRGLLINLLVATREIIYECNKDEDFKNYIEENQITNEDILCKLCKL